MRRIIYITILSALALAGCERHYDPYAEFTVNTDLAEPFEWVYFTNYSNDADTYFWDFGDGYVSEEINPRHYYNEEGTYIVRLTASNRQGGSDIAQLTIEVYYTQLEVTVAEWNNAQVITNRIPSAKVTLYATYSDWLNLRNPVEVKFTDSYGVAYFPNLDPIVYYIDVYHPYYNNEDIGFDDIGFIKTLPLEKTQINTFIAWVDPVPLNKKGTEIRVREPSRISDVKRNYLRPADSKKLRE